MTRFHLTRENAAGLLLMAVSVGLVVFGWDLRVGSFTRMGPGFMPMALGVLLFVSSIGVLIAGRADTTPLPSFTTTRPLLALTGAFLAFAFAIEPLGLALAMFLSVAIASTAAPPLRIVETLAYAALLSALGALLFVGLLGLPLKLLP